jgi:hypothetical protein
MKEQQLINVLIILILIGLGTVIKWIYKLTKYIIKAIVNNIKKINVKKGTIVNFPQPIQTEEQTYYESLYYKEKHCYYHNLINDVGAYGEYLIYDYLKDLQNSGGKFLFNTYLSKNQTETTEIDVMLIHQCGIFVFESKNYSGWIFGNEKDDKWTQTLPAKRGTAHKEHFYNPIKQNQTHIKALKEQILEDIPIYSIIVFSERCELKEIKADIPNTYIIKRNDILQTITKILFENRRKLSETEIENLYNNLYPYTKVSEDIKQKHIDDINMRMK